jgi:hypothetical protein
LANHHGNLRPDIAAIHGDTSIKPVGVAVTAVMNVAGEEVAEIPRSRGAAGYKTIIATTVTMEAHSIVDSSQGPTLPILVMLGCMQRLPSRSQGVRISMQVVP